MDDELQHTVVIIQETEADFGLNFIILRYFLF